MDFTHTTVDVQQLQQQVIGRVLTPDNADYEQMRHGHNLSINQYPALILMARNAQDVVAGVRFAREAGLNIAVQSTGHGLQHPANDSLLIITSRMKGVQADFEARTVQVEAGVVWQEVLDVVTPHGLAPLLGSSPHVGVVGYSLGAGIGWLVRRYGFAGDSIRWIDVVTADGVLRRASPTENSDLFWGLRGGGGNFGVVTALAFDLYPVASIYGGSLTYSAEVIGEALRFFRDWIKTVPDELTSSIAIFKFPSLPQLPEAMRGKIQVVVRAAFVGDPTEGAAWIQQWVDWCAPVANTFRELPFSEIGAVSNDPVDAAPVYGSNETLNDLSDEAIDVVVRYATNSASPIMMMEFRHAGGAVTRVAPDANAIGNRDAQLFLQMGGMTPDDAARERMRAYIAEYRNAMQPYLRGGVYLNFMVGTEAQNRAKDAYLPENYERLVALKAKYDPDNVFRFTYQLVKTA
ncbi:MAG: FAD-binding oxidoreductase [Anaerolineae bacterium]|nr:FAD-binding oxidoreductase [Anaerolineae bacterium]